MPYQVVSNVWICANLIGEKYLSVILICIFLIMSEVKHAFMCSKAICLSFYQLPHFLPHLLLGFFKFSFTILRSYVLEQTSGSQLGVIFPPSLLPSLGPWQCLEAFLVAIPGKRVLLASGRSRPHSMTYRTAPQERII